MTKVTHQEKAVADRLRHEIGESRPEFSEGLHDRLFQGLQQYRANRMPSPIRQATARRLSRWASFAAATCILVAVCGTWYAIHVARDAKSAPLALANIRKAGLSNLTELADRVAVKTDTLVDTAVKSHRWANLDNDAQALLKMPAARLPFDVVTSLLSVRRQDRVRGPTPHDAKRSENHAI